MTLQTVPINTSQTNPNLKRMNPIHIFKLLHLLGSTQNLAKNGAVQIPFTADDATLGVENELQTAVKRGRSEVDLPVMIEQSSYYKNLIKQAQTGDAPYSALRDLDDYLKNQDQQLWENSWVRFPGHLLNSYAKAVFENDLLADKASPDGCWRQGKDNRSLFKILDGDSAPLFVKKQKNEIIAETLPLASLHKMIQLLVLVIDMNKMSHETEE